MPSPPGLALRAVSFLIHGRGGLGGPADDPPERPYGGAVTCLYAELVAMAGIGPRVVTLSQPLSAGLVRPRPSLTSLGGVASLAEQSTMDGITRRAGAFRGG
jgi:hypothetical protein